MSTNVEISGVTRMVFVIADPIFQIKTPQAQNQEWMNRKQDLVTVPAHVQADDIDVFLDSLRVNQSAAGAVVTVPHKQTAVDHLDVLGPNAGLTGAVNAIRRNADGTLIGETFDGEGFVAGLRAEGIEPAGMNVRVIGAGGAASAVSVALARAAVASIRIQNRTVSKANELVDRIRDGVGFEDVAGWAADSPPADLVVNATSLGMLPGEVVSFDLSGMMPEAIAADVIVSETDTPFLAAAAAQGLRTHGGRHMLVGQMSLIADFMLAED